MNRTHNNGELRIENVGSVVELKGWVAKKRNLGSLVFIDLRDRYGITQIVVNEEQHDDVKSIRNEYVLHVKGKVIERSSKNPNMNTGDIEIETTDITVINSANVTPIIVADQTDALEETRMQYRYLDLRRPVLQEKLFMRHQITKAARNYLDGLDFVDVETPMFNKSTPEGARDFLVPSRVHNGSFYALPQSPQLFKQLLMIAGFEKYYQIAKCFRDEDLRADRQPEFTQIDVEMSFMSTDQILSVAEGLIGKVMKDVKGIDVKVPFDRITWKESMERFGIDKPDVRFGLELINLNDVVNDVDFMVFKSALEAGGHVKGMNVKGQSGNYSRKALDKLTDIAKTYKAKGLAWLKIEEGKPTGPIEKFFTEDQMDRLLKAMDASDGDLLLFVGDASYDVVCDSLAALRNHLGKELELYNPDEFAFLWVVDFPMFEFDEETNRYYAKHHPFTRPKDSDIDLLESDPINCYADAYDLVLNGFELGGGSQRIYEQSLQERAFKALGFSDEQIKEQFGFFVDAFQYGTPPHGGFALGLDRVAMLLSGSESLRDVIAFPKNTSSVCPMSKAPGNVSSEQLDELGIKVKCENNE